MKTRITKHTSLLKANQLADQGNVLGAAKIFRALELDDPGNPQIKLPLAVALFQLGDYDGTIKVISEYMDLMPEAYFTNQLRGRALSKLDKFESALVDFDLEIKKNPRNAEVYCDKAYALIELDRFEESLDLAKKAVQLDPKIPEAYDCMAISLSAHGELACAIVYATKALDLDSNNPDFQRTLGDIFYNLDNFESALECYGRSLELDPNFKIGDFQKSQVFLMTCRFDLGWQLYESRHLIRENADKKQYQDFSKIDFSSKEKLLIHKEQGIGDQILFASLFFEIDKDDKEVFIEVDDRLIKLLERSFSYIKFFGTKNFPKKFTPDINFSMGSLGGFLRQSIDNFQNQKKQFLRSDPLKRDWLTNRLSTYKLKSNQKICGISWRSKNKRLGRQKSIELNQLESILKLPDILFVNLQYNVFSHELNSIKKIYGIDIINFTDIDIYNDIDSLCALIDACDFVVSTSNLTAHLAGGLGKKTYLLASKGEGKLFYWHQGMKKNLWYPSIEVFKQHKFADWSHPIGEIKEEIVKAISHE